MISSKVWLDYLCFVGISFLVLELGSIAWLHHTGATNIYDWTLSDTIRRWAQSYRWLAPMVIAAFVVLSYHFFVQQNAT